jgi:hypothetical protein
MRCYFPGSGEEVMTVTVAKAPPTKATANKPSGKTVAATASDVTKARTEAITSLGQFAQLPLMITKQYADVGAIELHWPKVSAEIANLAATNEQVAKIVDPMMQVGPYAGLITAVMPMLVQVLVNHGRVTPGAAGSVSPTTLSSQVEASLAETELESLTIQRDAERKSAEVRQQIAAQRKALMEGTPDA